MAAEKSNKFQTILLIVFGVGLLIGVIMFALTKSGGGSGETEVVFWGTFPRRLMDDTLVVINDQKKVTGVTVRYVEQDPLTYESDLVEAFASGLGPDVFMINQDMIIPHENKIRPLGYESFSERDYRLRYVDGASIFLNDNGVLAFPFAVDPLVMYYNKNMFNTAGIAEPPTSWVQFAGLVPMLTQRDSNQNIIKSGLAFGNFSNIQHASEVFETLLLQLGNSIISKDNADNYISIASRSNNSSTNPLALSLQFFTNFANPLLETYSWNSSFQSAEDMFVQDRLAMYFAPASKFQEIQRKNINLNYDITKLPQVSETSTFVTSGDFYGVAVSRTSRNSQAAFSAANLIANGDVNKTITEALALSPVRRDLLRSSAGLTPYQEAIRESALISYTWLNPGGAGDAVLEEAVSSVIRGAYNENAASRNVDNQMTLILNQYNNR
jgi:ABC-type glycerol-3-phosphate transport system substrate-binding protein